MTAETYGPSFSNGVLTFASGCDVPPVRFWTPFKRNENGAVIPKKALGFWFHVTDPDPATNLRGFGVYRPGFEICRRRWDGTFWIRFGRFTVFNWTPNV